MDMPMTLWKRQSQVIGAINDVKDVPKTFSSFQNCMSKNYCKYLFIFGCVAAGITLICLIACVACCCCGVKNCCCPGRTKTKYRDSYRPPPAPNHGGGAPPPPGAYHPPAYVGAAAVAGGGSQFATFDVSKPRNDALPAMPSWDTASTRKVEVEEDVELGTLDPPGTAKTNNSQHPMLNNAAGFGHAAGPTDGHRSPHPAAFGHGMSPTESHRGPSAAGYMDHHGGYATPGSHNQHDNYDHDPYDHHDSHGGYANSSYNKNPYHTGNENSGWSSSPHPSNYNSNANRPYSPYGPPSAGEEAGHGAGSFNFSRGPGAYSSVNNGMDHGAGNGAGGSMGGGAAAARYSPPNSRPQYERGGYSQTPSSNAHGAAPYPDERSHTPMIAPSPRHGNLGSNFYDNRNDYNQGGMR